MTKPDAMSDPTNMIRTAGIAAALGGGLRVLSPLLAPHLDDRANQVLWIGIDFLLLVGTATLFLATRRRVGMAGLLAGLTAILGLLILRSSAEPALGKDGYVVGVAVWGLGQAAFALIILVGRAEFRLACWCWLAAPVIAVLGGLLPLSRIGGLNAVELAMTVFACGFIAAGVEMLHRPASLPKLGASA